MITDHDIAQSAVALSALRVALRDRKVYRRQEVENPPPHVCCCVCGTSLSGWIAKAYHTSRSGHAGGLSTIYWTHRGCPEPNPAP